jgi:hypothetical protein
MEVGIELRTTPSETSEKRAIGSATAHQTAHFRDVFGPDLARVVAAWPNFPATVKATIVAAVEVPEGDGLE